MGFSYRWDKRYENKTPTDKIKQETCTVFYGKTVHATERHREDFSIRKDILGKENVQIS